MNPLAHLIPALYATLAGLAYDGVAVPVYTHLAANRAGHYVLLTQPTDGDAGGATGCDQFSCTMLLDVVTQFPADAASTVPAEAIVSQIHELLRKKRLVLPDGWDCQPGVALPSQQLEELDTYRRVRRLLRYRWDVFYHA